ncbi:FAD-dependent oxidoreductase [Adlercreutzia sp. R25]|uniref:FAD-dependent oxidoreductase n=1 Tax=Adlercreutzia shanghongiae TaxID=3111773 RepID=A0ABU6IVG9_9ACTN|nr:MULTISPECIES: FAD-dependent oxidoreductase [unclassified Adlercreutzia]MEC4272095.1 FAD-dependent oxidoreductase [Adlercreutzia sp. R25]MEC4293826.1 FAD-dependent oxidoreductase [Adlercreutzia sp. R22]
MELSRRNFLKGAAVFGGAAAAVSLAGCAPGEKEPLGKTGETTAADWLGTPPDYTVDDCSSTVETEVLVVGSALAGCMTAYGAMRNGAQVTVLERNNACHVGGQLAAFLNSKYQRECGIPEYNKVSICNDVLRDTQMRADMGLWAIWAERSGEIFDDLREHVLDPYGQFYEAESMENFYPDPSVEITQYNSSGIRLENQSDKLTRFLENMHKWIPDNGGVIDYNVRAEKLVQDETGRVTGVIASKGNEKVYYHASKGVVMCTGSFGANEAMMREFYPSDFAEFAINNNAYASYMDEAPTEILDDGLGHRMLCWVGAKMEEVCSYQAWQNRGYIMFPYLQVNANGQRFMNECIPGLVATHSVTCQPHFSNYTWQILPSNDFDMPNVFGMTIENVDMQGGFDTEHVEANTIEELAEKIGVDPKNLADTVAHYNELCTSGSDSEYLKAPRYLDPIDDPPYQAWKAQYNFFCTTSGVRCSNQLEVLDADFNPIPGLYAAGNTVGYRFGSCYQNTLHGATNSLAIAHGYVAGEILARA